VTEVAVAFAIGFVVGAVRLFRPAALWLEDVWSKRRQGKRAV